MHRFTFSASPNNARTAPPPARRNLRDCTAAPLRNRTNFFLCQHPVNFVNFASKTGPNLNGNCRLAVWCQASPWGTGRAAPFTFGQSGPTYQSFHA